MGASPLITIGVTCYNGEETIARALDSALAQDWVNKRIIVVDDGSSDDSIEILKSYEAQYEIVSVISHGENRGTPSARNSLLENFAGEYLAFFDDDDWSYPNRLTEQYQRMHQYSEDVGSLFCYCGKEVIQGNEEQGVGELLIGHTPPEPFGVQVALYILLEELAGLKNVVNPVYAWGKAGTGTLMLHRSAIDKVGRFDTSLTRCQDLDYAIRASLLGMHFVSVDRILMRQYLTKGSDKSKGLREKAKLSVVLKYKDFLREHNSLAIALCMTHPVLKPIKSIAKRMWRFTSK